MVKYPFLSLSRSNEPLSAELKRVACEVIESGRYLKGEQTALLERELSSLCESDYCVAVSNGLDALRLILRGYKELNMLHDGDRVIVAANTYVASVLAISDCGLQPVLCEPAEDTLNLDTSRLEELITPDTRAVMPVHLYGTPCWDERLIDIARRHNLLVIEDNAQAIGARAGVAGFGGGRVTGGLGHAAALSFYPTKNLGALGDAGAIVTCDKALADVVRAIANYGSDYRYHNIYQGLNCRIDELQAALLRVKLRHLSEENEHRRAVALAYDKSITNGAVTRPVIFEDMEQVWHQYVVQVDERERFRRYLLEHGIETDVHYATPPHRQPCYRRFSGMELPITERIADRVVSLPIANITPHDAVEIASVINKY